jgi:hypothetical protein
MKQQLSKLAATSLVESDFLLTLDADVICAKPTRTSISSKEIAVLVFQGRNLTLAMWSGIWLQSEFFSFRGPESYTT